MARTGKYDRLLELLRSYGSVAVAFSGGVDSTLLLYAAREALGDKAIAVTVMSDFIPKWESKEAEEYCRNKRIEHKIHVIEGLTIEGFAANPKDRCYICKKALFTKMLEIAKNAGCEAVVEGSVMDDLSDYRPGLKALSELNIKSPLREAGLTKAEVRELSRQFSLPTAEKPSYACLASRFVYGEEITTDKLRMVEEAEEILMERGFKNMRVRIHGMMARIEVPEKDFNALLEIKDVLIDRFKALGFTYITMDLQGFRSGSMNEVIKK